MLVSSFLNSKKQKVVQKVGKNIKSYLILFVFCTLAWSSFIISFLHHKSHQNGQNSQSFMIIFGFLRDNVTMKVVEDPPLFQKPNRVLLLKRGIKLIGSEKTKIIRSSSSGPTSESQNTEVPSEGNRGNGEKNGKTNEIITPEKYDVLAKSDALTSIKSDYLDESDPFVRHQMVDSGKLRLALGKMEPGRPIMGTIANSGFEDLLQNWIKHVFRSSINNILVASLDADIHKVVTDMGVTSILLNNRVRREDFRRDPEAFKHMGSLKTAFILSILEMGWDILMSDADVAWLRDPLHAVHAKGPMGRSDIMVSSDSISHLNDVESMKADPTTDPPGSPIAWYKSASPRGEELFGNVYDSDFNSGILFLRATPATLNLCRAWHDAMRTRGQSQGWDNLWGDQHALNLLLHYGMFPIKVVEPEDGSPRHNHVFWAFQGRLKLGILAPSEFCNGHVFFVQRIPQTLGIDPYAVHNTFQFHYSAGKVARFRENGLWLMDSDKLYTNGNFLTFDVDLPSWIYDVPEGFMRHRAAMEHYFAALQNAFAVADILDRYLVIPKVTCFCDRWWDSLPEPCRAPGADVVPPFFCPLDHLLDLTAWGYRENSSRYRDSNFLDSPRLDPAIRTSRSIVGLQGIPSSEESQIFLPANATNVEVWMSLGPFRDIRILHLQNTVNAFCRYETELENQYFDWKTWNFFLLKWCCDARRLDSNVTVPPLASRTYAGCNRRPPTRISVLAV